MLQEEIDKLMEYFGDEPLHPDLEACVTLNYRGEAALRHPLVNMLFFTPQLHKTANRQYVAKRDAVAEAEADGDWHTYIWLHERPWRFAALTELRRMMPEPDWLALAKDVWGDSENIHEHFHDWLELFGQFTPRQFRRLWMDEDDWALLRSQPALMTVYRGQSGMGCNELPGLSWTTDPTKAIWFATRFSSGPGDRKLYEGTVHRSKVIAAITYRGESEIVVDPAHVKIVRSAYGKWAIERWAGMEDDDE